MGGYSLYSGGVCVALGSLGTLDNLETKYKGVQVDPEMFKVATKFDSRVSRWEGINSEFEFRRFQNHEIVPENPGTIFDVAIFNAKIFDTRSNYKMIFFL